MVISLKISNSYRCFSDPLKEDQPLGTSIQSDDVADQDCTQQYNGTEDASDTINAIETAARNRRQIVLEQLESLKTLVFEVRDPGNLSDISSCLEKLIIQVKAGGKTQVTSDEFASKLPTINTPSPWIRCTKKLYTPLPKWTKRKKARRSLKDKLEILAGNCPGLLAFMV